jgi:hypothetical protein
LVGWPGAVDGCWPTPFGFNLITLEVDAALPVADWLAAFDACGPELDDRSVIALEFGAAG